MKKLKRTIKQAWYNDPVEIRYSLEEINPNVPSHTQIIHFKGGDKKTITNIIRIDEGQMLCLTTNSGKEFIINTANVLFTERYEILEV